MSTIPTTTDNFETATSDGVIFGEDGEIIFPADIELQEIATGPAFVIHTNPGEPELDDNKIQSEQISDELQDLKFAHSKAVARYSAEEEQAQHIPEDLRDESLETSRNHPGGILGTETMMIKDEGTLKNIEDLIRKGKTAKRAIWEIYQDKIKQYESKEFTLRFVPHAKKAMAYMLGHWPEHRTASIQDVPHGHIPITRFVATGMVGYFFDEHGMPITRAMVNSEGTKTDHTNIVGKSAGIAIGRISDEYRKKINNGDTIIVDGKTKKIIVNPNAKTKDIYAEVLKEQNEYFEELAEKSRQDHGLTKTLNDKEIRISANIEFSSEAKIGNSLNANGIGLYRTELSVIGKTTAPSIDKCKRNFICVAEALDSRILDIRTVDFEGDKAPDMPKSEQDQMVRNQMAGAMLARKHFSDNLRKTEEIAKQRGQELDEETRKKYDKQIDMMIPNIVDSEDFNKYQTMMNEEAEKLSKQFETTFEPIKLGAMAEIPALYDHLQDFPEEFKDLAFLSFGGNDGTANDLGYDRNDENLQDVYDPTNRTILKHMNIVTNFAKNNGIKTSCCGDMASTPRYFALLMGVEFKSLSTGIHAIPEIKELVRRIDTDEAKLLSDTMRKIQNRAEREKLLDEFNLMRLGLHPDGTINTSWKPPTTKYAPVPLVKVQEELQARAPSADHLA